MVHFHAIIHSNIDPQNQINLAKEIRDNYQRYYKFLNWKTFPDRYQVQVVCELIFKFLIVKPQANVLSGKQLAFRINGVRVLKNIRALIEQEIQGKTEPEEINEAIENVLDFVRGWAQYNFPKYLMALNRIQNEIYSEKGVEPGDFGYFATQIECMFTDPLFVALDEYGIPIQTSNKIKDNLDLNGDLDYLLLQIRELQVDKLDIMPFEKEILHDAKQQV
jgi:hypothetical protein